MNASPRRPAMLVCFVLAAALAALAPSVLVPAASAAVGNCTPTATWGTPGLTSPTA